MRYLGQEHARELSDARLQAENSLRLEAESAVLLFSNAVHHLNNPLNHVLGATLYVNHITSEVRTFSMTSLQRIPSMPRPRRFDYALMNS